jgi:branched-subunit amino acid transport protein
VPDRLEATLTDVWIAVAAVGAGTIVLKAAGPVLLGGRPLPHRVMGVVELLAPALLAALVVTQAVGGDRKLVFDARLVGLAAAIVALRARAPLLLVVVIAAAAAALARLL